MKVEKRKLCLIKIYGVQKMTNYVRTVVLKYITLREFKISLPLLCKYRTSTGPNNLKRFEINLY